MMEIITKPIAESTYSKWTFHLASGTKTLYQLAPQYYDPVTDCIEHLRLAERVLGGQNTVNASRLPVEKASPLADGDDLEPRVNDTHRVYDKSGRDLDMSEVVQVYWWEMYSELVGDHAIYTTIPPAYEWDVWYEAGKPTEAQFRMLRKSGEVEPMFDIPRGTLETVVEALQAPGAVTAMFNKAE